MNKKTTTESPCVEVDSSFLKNLLGYNTRRVTLKIFEIFAIRTKPYGLKPVEFSVLSLIGRNTNISHSQLCEELDLLAPNLTKILQKLKKRNLITSLRPESDKRSVYLKLTNFGIQQLIELEEVISQLENDSAIQLTKKELAMLIKLLQKIYLAPPRA